MFARICYFVLISNFLFLSGSVFAQSIDDNVIPGRIAFIGEDFNVYTVDPAGNKVIKLTNDASISSSRKYYYRWPTWSLDGRLAYFSVTESISTPYTSNAYVSADGLVEGELIYEGIGEAFNYASWAPANCDASENCRNLAILMSDVSIGGLFVEVVQDQVEGNPATAIGRGGPFYYSWSPDGENMIWQRNNRRLDIYDIVAGEVTLQLEQRPGFFQAPYWSPKGDRWLIGEINESGTATDLVIVSKNEEKITLASGLTGLLTFAWSPDGTSVAYVDRQGPLIVLDVNDGAIISRTVTNGIGSYFWSPDSSKIAFLTLATPPGSFSAKSGGLASGVFQDDAIGLVWAILDVETGNIQRYGAFAPTSEMVYMFTYFDQFAQSHQVWSPDSRYIVYSEITPDGKSVISLIDTELDDTLPLAIADGYLAIWSFE